MNTKHKQQGHAEDSTGETVSTVPDRRQFITGVTAGTAAGIGVATVGQWVRPVVDYVSLPAHAQTSAEPDPDPEPVVDVGSIESVELSSSTLTIGGASVPYSMELNNPTGATLSVIAVQAYVEQGTASRAASGALIAGCGTSLGELDPGDCTHVWSLFASNTTAGSGTLVPGPATARFELRDDGVVIDQIFADITLV